MDQKNLVVVGITGGSASGKSFFLRGLAERVGEKNICLFQQDHYYLRKEEQPLDELGIHNFDLPESLDREAFYRDLMRLKSGEIVTRQEYTFNNPVVIPKMLEFKPSPLLIVEGLFVTYFSEVARELDLKIFIEAKDHIKLSRRIRRDQIERGYGLDDVLYRYEKHVMPVYERLIEPLRHFSDLVIPNNANMDKALDVVAAYIQSKVGM